jgi:hypothetical protein
MFVISLIIMLQELVFVGVTVKYKLRDVYRGAGKCGGFGYCNKVCQNEVSNPVFPNLFNVAVPLTSLFISHCTP